MSDIQMVETQIQGLEANIHGLRDEERVLFKAQGLAEQIEAAKARCADLKSKLAKAKDALAETAQEKQDAVRNAGAAFAEAMGDVLAEGAPVFDVDVAGNVILGWQAPDGRIVPYAGLSGGEKAAFDPALAYALMPKEAENRVIIIEAAELDSMRLRETLERIAASDPDAQIIVNTCHEPAVVPQGWTVVKMEAANAA
ncbi:hypothetical protein [Oceanidesulfovibrio marinus]|uniref:Uncharacterized protein n=1 Tax=Oceanidesulfovibrio marinus TaxID=370038 RepID=A0A6P1ZKM5_9BACT|nr:hypothetical protein [Oceanidesulfovibrio marinus]TVM35644.1 hypothetical protein DQK91_02970 [Oceanidesulfovibrio marinus]